MAKTMLNLNELKKLENNPRYITEKEFERLKDSIRKNGFFAHRPIAVSNRTGELVILAGNQRYEAAKALGLTEVPVEIYDNPTEKYETEIILRDNKLNGEFDQDMLANHYDQSYLEEIGIKTVEYYSGDFDEDEEQSAAKPTPNTIKITFQSPEHVQKAENDIQEIIDRKYPNAVMKINV